MTNARLDKYLKKTVFGFDGMYKVQTDRWINGQLDKVIKGQAERQTQTNIPRLDN
jgi:hypothetical protein